MNTFHSIPDRPVKRTAPKKRIPRGKERRFYGYISSDFKQRCAYSMVHERQSGPTGMHIEHHNPLKKQEAIQDYENLFLSTAHCNGAKGNKWPDSASVKKGNRFLNCCKEIDYGIHIVEDVDNGLLVGLTAAGRYHIKNLHLNAKHLVDLRLERTKLRSKVYQKMLLFKSPNFEPIDLVPLKRMLELAIPPIKPINRNSDG